MQKWEYMHLAIVPNQWITVVRESQAQSTHSWMALNEVLNELGELGWETTGVIPPQSGTSESYLLLKRPRQG